MNDKVREELATYAHKAWTGWMDYLFKKSSHNNDGTVTIPKWAVERWMEQCATPYNALSEIEKNSDRAEANEMLKIISRDKEVLQLTSRVAVAEGKVAELEYEIIGFKSDIKARVELSREDKRMLGIYKGGNEELKAENKKLREDKAYLSKLVEDALSDKEYLEKRLVKLKAENKKLREEIKTVASCGFTPDGLKVNDENVITWLKYLIDKDGK